jgi:Glutathione S-transferase, N-terminal domain
MKTSHSQSGPLMKPRFQEPRGGALIKVSSGWTDDPCPREPDAGQYDSRSAQLIAQSKGRDMITLYDFGNSVACQKVRITMCEKGLDWQTVTVDLFKAEQFDPEYLKLNPKGVVPTIVHDGNAVIESTLICEYLADRVKSRTERFPTRRMTQ